MKLLLLLALLQVSPAPEVPRVLRAGPGEPFATPAAAVAAARAGDTVRVAAGRYPGSLVVDRRVVLLGEGRPTLDGGRKGSAVTLAADSVVIAGFEIVESGRSLDSDDAALKVVRCTGCRVIDNRIRESLHGIYLLQSTGVEVRDNTVHGDSSLDEARRGNGIHLFDSHGSRIEGNVVRRARDGIYFNGSGNTSVVRNDVAHVRYGLHYMYSHDNDFRGNRFARSAAGAAIMTSQRIRFTDNVFAEHVGYRAYGVLLQNSEDIVAERNRIEGNLIGLFIDASSRNTFRGNAIVGNGIGIDLMASAEHNLFAGNAISHNRVPVRKVMGSGVDNRWEEGGRGNYWGDPAVFDLDGDGIGERPFRPGDAFSTLAAARPVLEVFAGTPAARALSWAEEAFPVFGVPRVVDPAPLAAPPAGVARPVRPVPVGGGAGGRTGVLAVLAGAAMVAVVRLRSRKINR